jgi:hypothetical protein
MMQLRILRKESYQVAPGSWVHAPRYTLVTNDTLQFSPDNYEDSYGERKWIDVPIVVQRDRRPGSSY